MILKQIFKNFDVKVQEPAALVMFTGLTEIYKTLIDIKNPQVLLTCELCLVDID